MDSQDSDAPVVKCNYPAEEDRGRTLHREFVGMVFALAIAEVAIQGAPIANANQSLEFLPAYSHLILATLIITASWVGWGRSKHSESNIKSVFSWDFVELCVDLWLVAVYFFIAKGVDVKTDTTPIEFKPSLENEAFWLCIALCTYPIWDVISKRKISELKQRIWGSLTCAVLGIGAYWQLPAGILEVKQVVIGDVSLAFLVLTFRATKVNNFSELTRGDWIRFVILLSLFLLAAWATIEYDFIADWYNSPTPVEAQDFPVLTAP